MSARRDLPAPRVAASAVAPASLPPVRPPARDRVLASRGALWAAFTAVHGWLALVGVVLVPARAFWDLDLYRYWASLALDDGRWPVLDDAWVYPAGALVPVVAPALTGARTTAGYALGWCVLVTVLDAIAVAVLLRAGRRAGRDGPAGPVIPTGAWWWLAFLAALGPVAMGRLDAVVAPLCVVALVSAARRPVLAATLLTAGAWVKVAPGVLLLPLVATARRPVRTVVLPAAAVCVVVVGAVAAAGGLGRIASFVTEQGQRGLQVESVAATPWVLAAVVDDRVEIGFDRRISTWEVTGPGTTTAVAVLGVVLPLAVAALAVLLLRSTAARDDGDADATAATDVLLWGALAATTVLLMTNKVGSPQLIGWLAAPVVVALTLRRPAAGDGSDPGWRTTGAGVLAIAALTQVVFPWGATAVVTSEPVVTAVLAVRNAGLVVLLVVALRRLTRAAARPPARRARGGRRP